MRKYALVQDIVSRLTDNPAFRTFYTLYLMAETEEERKRIDQEFVRQAKTLSESEYHEFRQSLPDVPSNYLPWLISYTKKLSPH